MNFRKISFLFLIFQLLLIARIALYSSNLEEFSYLHTDRSMYITGENVYFKLYIMNANSKQLSLVSKVGYLMLVSEDANPNLKMRVKIENGMANGSFQLPDTLKSGSYQLVAFTSAMNNENDSLQFRKSLTVVNRSDKDLESLKYLAAANNSKIDSTAYNILLINLTDSIFNKKESVSVVLNTTCSSANISISVYEKPPFSCGSPSIIETFSNASKISLNLKYGDSPIENKGKILKGSVINKQNNEPVNDIVVLMSCLDSIPNLQYALSNKNGDFEFLLDEYYDGKELFVSNMNTTIPVDLQIKIEDIFSINKNTSAQHKEKNLFAKEFIARSQQLAYINQTYEFERDSVVSQTKDNKKNIHSFYKCNPITIIPDEYESLNNFSEIVTELLPQVRFSKRNGIFTMYNAITGQYGGRGAAVFLDGVFVDDVNKLMNLGTPEIKKIDILTEDRAFGDLIFGGLVAVTSKNKSMEHSVNTVNSLRIMNDTVTVGKRFSTISPSKIHDARVPFFKQLLYWNPNLQISNSVISKFEFFTSNHEGTYVIQIEGVSENGKPISLKSEFKVVNKKQM